MLGLHQNAGVSKRAKRGRKSVLSTRARARRERGLEKAEAIVDRTATKVQKSKQAASLVETRKKSWEEINAVAGKAGKKGANMFAGLQEEEEEEEQNDGAKDDWEEVQELDDEMAEVEPVASAKATSTSSSAASAPAAPPPVDEDEDIL